MAILKASEIREMENDEIEEHLEELYRELMRIKGITASGGVPEDIGKGREIKRTIARILTIQNETKK